MKLSNIIAFNDFYSTIANENMNITLAYKMNKIISNFSKDIEFYQAELIKIFNDCVEKTEDGQFKTTDDGQNFIIIKDKISEFEQRFTELQNIEVNFNENDKIDISSLENLTVTPLQLQAIQEFIK